ncbi:hypothetical protein GGR56DRAFT_143317 [Xylariaceae sp. FL0804]|nr:hypothetical protein GGR56DRAFT_143317 [Xylariaceae sp. FL0804]
MDPFTAIGLASAIVQFVDFSVSLLSDTVEVYKSASGQTSRAVEFTTIGNDLGQLMVALLWQQSKSEAIQLGDIAAQLARIEDATLSQNQTLNEVVQGSTSMDPQQQQAMDSIWSSTRSEESPIQDEATVFSKEILNSLSFEDRDVREESIPRPYEETYKWIFEPRTGTDDTALWSDFTAWLQEPGNEIYWVTGKPGAGKSTLMKYVITHPKLRELLEKWSATKPLVVASFYFWKAGTAIQRSQEGLLRTLLHQCLSQQPWLVPEVCPRRWALCKIFGHKATPGKPKWTCRELLESLSDFSLHAGSDFNLALLIDGLDEYDGEHDDLLGLLRTFQDHSGTKVCVSSRPWNVFQDAFTRNPNLRLEDLTRDDLDTYVRGRFASSAAFGEYQVVFRSRADHLVQDILDKAQGVFLWVTLVLNAILEGLREGDSMEDMQGLVDSLPKDLSQLYDHIWASIKPAYIEDSSRLIQIYEAYPVEGMTRNRLDAVTMWVAQLDNPENIDTSTPSHEQQNEITKLLRRRLNSRTRGLLDISPDDTVGYIHRTAREWIESRWADIVAKSRDDFDANLCLLNSMASQVKNLVYWDPILYYDALAPVLGLDPVTRIWIAYVYPGLWFASRVREDKAPGMIRALDRIDAAFASFFRGRSPIAHAPHEDSSSEYVRFFFYEPPGTPGQSPTCATGMTEFAAQFNISRYIREKIKDAPHVLPSLLFSTVCGSLIHDLNLASTDDDLALRAPLLGFLLESSTNKAPVPKDSVSKHQQISHRDLAKLILGEIRSHRLNRESDLADWEAMAEVLDEFVLGRPKFDLKLGALRISSRCLNRGVSWLRWQRIRVKGSRRASWTHKFWSDALEMMDPNS